MRTSFSLVGLLALLLAVLVPTSAAAQTALPTYNDKVVDNNTQVWVCKYVQSPNGETQFKGGKNPLLVNWSSVPIPELYDGALEGRSWTDAQGQRAVTSEVVGSESGCDPAPVEDPSLGLTSGCMADEGYIQVAAVAYPAGTSFTLTATLGDMTETDTGTADADDGAATLRLDGLADGTWSVSFTADSDEQLSESDRSVTIDCDSPTATPSSGCVIADGFIQVVASGYEAGTAFELTGTLGAATSTDTGTADDAGAATLRLNGLADGTWGVSFTADDVEVLSTSQRSVTIDCDVPVGNGPDLVSATVIVEKEWVIVDEGAVVSVDVDASPSFVVTLGSSSQPLDGAGSVTFPGLQPGTYDVSVTEVDPGIDPEDIGEGCVLQSSAPVTSSVTAPGSVTVTVTNSYVCTPQISVLPEPPLVNPDPVDPPDDDPVAGPADPDLDVGGELIVAREALPETGAPTLLLALLGLMGLGLGGGLVTRRRRG